MSLLKKWQWRRAVNALTITHTSATSLPQYALMKILLTTLPESTVFPLADYQREIYRRVKKNRTYWRRDEPLSMSRFEEVDSSISREVMPYNTNFDAHAILERAKTLAACMRDILNEHADEQAPGHYTATNKAPDIVLSRLARSGASLEEDELAMTREFVRLQAGETSGYNHQYFGPLHPEWMVWSAPQSSKRIKLIEEITRFEAQTEKDFLRVILSVSTDQRLVELAGIPAQRTRLDAVLPLGEVDQFGEVDRYESYRHLRGRVDHLLECSPAQTLGKMKQIASMMRAAVQVETLPAPVSSDSMEDPAVEALFDITVRLTESEIASKLSSAQEFALVKLCALTIAADQEHIFIPYFKRRETENCFAGKVTLRVLDDPSIDLNALADEYVSRMRRLRELESKTGSELLHEDNLCDYPEWVIDKIIKITGPFWNRASEIVCIPEMDATAMESLLRDYDAIGSNNSLNLPFVRSMAYVVDSYPEMIRGRQEVYSQALLREQRAALLRVSVALSDIRGLQERRIADQRLIDILMKNPHEGEVIAKTIADRQRYDFDELQSVLSGGVLGEGAL